MPPRECEHGNKELVPCVSESSIQVIDSKQQSGSTDVVGHKAATLTGHLAMVSSVAFSPDQQWLCSASEDKKAPSCPSCTRRGGRFSRRSGASTAIRAGSTTAGASPAFPMSSRTSFPDFQASELRPAPADAPDAAADGWDPAATALSLRSAAAAAR